MKIVKYSKCGSNKYKVYLENNECILLHEDVILKNDLLIKKEIEDVSELLKQNSKYEIYDVSIKYLSHKLRSIKEMREYLQKKGYLENDINKTIDNLTDKGYLNDSIYCKSYINDKINFSNDGPLKIIKYLESMDINNDVYSKYLDLFSEELIYEKINKYIDKMIKTNKKSKYILKNKIIVNLINLGYLKEDINYCLNKIDDIDDRNNYEITKEKLYKKLQKKYSGNELDRKVKEKLYQLGYFE